MTDPIADLFTRIRNGQMVRHPRVDVPGSKMKSRIVEILKEEGYLQPNSPIENSFLWKKFGIWIKESFF